MADRVTAGNGPRDSAIAVIKAEHRALGSAMHLLQQVTQDVFVGRIEPDQGLIASLLYYIGIFPERCHHPKEDEFLFRLLRERTSAADAVLDELQAQHVRGTHMLSYLQQLYVHWIGGAPDGLRHFADAVESYAMFLRDHMEKEENLILPLAEKHLRESDWREIDAAFRANEDPLGGNDLQQEFRRLKQRIATLLPRKLKPHGGHE